MLFRSPDRSTLPQRASRLWTCGRCAGAHRRWPWTTRVRVAHRLRVRTQGLAEKRNRAGAARAIPARDALAGQRHRTLSDRRGAARGATAVPGRFVAVRLFGVRHADRPGPADHTCLAGGRRHGQTLRRAERNARARAPLRTARHWPRFRGACGAELVWTVFRGWYWRSAPTGRSGPELSIDGLHLRPAPRPAYNPAL